MDFSSLYDLWFDFWDMIPDLVTLLNTDVTDGIITALNFVIRIVTMISNNGISIITGFGNLPALELPLLLLENFDINITVGDLILGNIAVIMFISIATSMLSFAFNFVKGVLEVVIALLDLIVPL